MDNLSIRELAEVIKAIAIEIKLEEGITDTDALNKTFIYLKNLGS